MRIIFVDDEEYMAIRFKMECESIPEVQLLGCFKSPLEAIEFAKDNYVEAAFLDIRMPEMTGLELSEKLRELYPEIVIVFISAHDKYMREALQDKGADYYILKPYSSTDIASVIERTQLLMKRQAKRVSIETFGRFSVYVDGRYLEFKSKKAKEALAVLVDNRGTSVDSKKIWNTLFEEEYDHSNASKVRRALLRLRKALEEEDWYVVQVIDDGVGFDPEQYLRADYSGESIGIANLAYRLREIVGAELEYESVIGEGTTGTIRFRK